MLRLLSAKMQDEIKAVVDAAIDSGQAVRVYAEAEFIRRANLADNVALEDIVEALIAGSTKGPGYISEPEDARDALLGAPSKPTLVQ